MLSVLLVILVHVMVDYLISRGYSGSLCSGKPGGQLLLPTTASSNRGTQAHCASGRDGGQLPLLPFVA